MIKQPKDYLAKKKKEHVIKSLMWGSIVLGIFMTGCLLTKQRANYFTVAAAVLVLPLALNITRGLAYRKYKDAKPCEAEILDDMAGNYHVFHSAVIPEATGIVFIEHIVVTSRSIYFLSSDEMLLKKEKPALILKLENKGFHSKQLHFIFIKEEQTMKNTAHKIEKEAYLTSEALEEMSGVIASMLM